MLLINDIHLSKDNSAEFHQNWQEAIDICKKYDIPTIVIGGDLWQSRAGQTLNVLMDARTAIIKATVVNNLNIIIESGNHDKVDPEAVWSYNHIFSEYANVDVVDDYAGYGVDNNVMLWLINYYPENGSFIEKLNEVVGAMKESDYNILYCHEGINGALATASDKELPIDIFKPFDKVLVGHYHNRTSIDNGRIEYIGSSRQHNFGEDEEKGYTILYSDGSIKFIKNKANTKYTTIEITSENLNQASDLLKKVSDKDTKIRLKISCTAEEAATIDKVALVEQGASKVEIITESMITKTETQDFSTKFDKNGLKDEYSKFCAQREIDNIEIGLQYLDKIENTCGE